MSVGSTSVLSKHTAFGFGLQAAYGTEAAGTIYWLPVNNRFTYKRVANRQYPTQADYAEQDRLQYSGGQWFEGDLPFIFTPSADAMTDLLAWIFDRDSYNQGRVASVYKYWEGPTGAHYESSIDVKITRCGFRFERGRPVMIAPTAVGRMPGAATPAFSMATRGGPYLWEDATLEAAYNGGAAAADLDIEALDFTVDNLVERPEEGLRFDGSPYPMRIDNTGGARVTGTIGRGFVDMQLMDAFAAQIGTSFGRSNDGALALSIARGGVTVGFGINGIQWNDPGPDFEGNNDTKIKQDGVAFHALSSLDGKTACISYSIA